MRKAYKRSLGLPDSTSNDKLAALGVHNRVDKKVEAKRMAQLERLTTSATGRYVLRSLGIRYETQGVEKVDIPMSTRETLQISPIPRDMHLVHDVKITEARAKALGRMLREVEGVTYVDAAEYAGRGAMAAAVTDGEGRLIVCGSVRTESPERAEETAIALALCVPEVKVIVCDAQCAVRNYAGGRISREAWRVLGGRAAKRW